MPKKLAVLGTSLAFASALLLPMAASATTSTNGLTSAQAAAIITLLQSFGASSDVIENVRVALGGTSSSYLSCSSFADLHYGSFDNAPGGRVSQLQVFLGIPSYTFGFGTYGLRTQAAWNARCGTPPLNCPVLSVMACPTGQHYAYGETTYDSRSCPKTKMWCVADSSVTPTCTYISNTTGQKNGIAWNTGVAQTATACLKMCTIVRNEKFGMEDSGTCIFTGANGAGQSIMSVPVGSPTCSAWYTPKQVFVNQLFRLSWSSTGMTYTLPHNQTGPTLRLTNHDGTSGVVLRGESGSQEYSDDKAETMKFQLGLGGFSDDQPFTPYCTLSVPVSDNSASYGTSINAGSLYVPTQTSFSVSGKSANASGSKLNVVLVPADYSGNRDWTTINALIVSGEILTSFSATVSEGIWTSGSVSGGSENTKYTVLVYDPSRANALVATALVHITDKG